LSCRTFAANAVRLQLHAVAYNLGNFLRTLATSEPIKDWSLTSLKEKLIKIGAKVVSHGRYIIFQIGRGRHRTANVPRDFAAHRGATAAATARASMKRLIVTRSSAIDRRNASHMPVKIARSAPRPSFGLPELLVAIHTSRQSCYKAGKSANIHASSGVIRGIPAKDKITLRNRARVLERSWED
jgi:Transposase DDE domain group 1